MVPKVDIMLNNTHNYIGFEMLIHRFTIFLCLYSYAVNIIKRIRVSSMISFKQLQVKNHITNILRDVTRDSS